MPIGNTLPSLSISMQLVDQIDANLSQIQPARQLITSRTLTK